MRGLTRVIAAFNGAWASWGAVAQFYMWMSLASVALITAGLALFGPCRKPRAATDPARP